LLQLHGDVLVAERAELPGYASDWRRAAPASLAA
jgi:hypothetical protein